jgi:hypothetical protein
MTAGQMRVDPQQLADSATSIGHQVEEFGTGLDELEATLTTDNPWGGDEAGTLFGAAYVEVLGHAMDAFGSHLGQLMEAAEGLVSWAQQVYDTEQQNIGTIDRSAAGLEA